MSLLILGVILGFKAQASDIQHTLGAPGWKKMPLLSRLTKSSSGLVGFDMKVFLDPPSNPNRKVFDSLYVNTSDIFLANYKNPQDQGEPLLSDSGWDVYTRRDIRVPIQPLSVWNR